MMTETKKAEVSTAAGTLGNGNGSSPQQVGLSMKINRFGRYCTTPDDQGMMSVPGGFAGCRLGGLLITRRNTATPGMNARGVSFCGFRTHGVIAPVPHYGQMPRGKSHDLSLPSERSANPRGVSHLLGGRWGISYKLTNGILAMMRTLSRNVSTAFPSIPEPIFLPVQSCHKRVEERPQVNTFADVADSAEGLFQRAQAAYREAAFLPSAVARAELRARVSDYLAELIAFCREVESLPAGQNLKEARHG